MLQREPLSRVAKRLGACLRSVRLLQDQGATAAARDLADAFARECGAAELAGDALYAFVGAASVQVHGSGASIVVEGVRDETIFVILHGQAAVRRFGTGDLARLGPGDFFGEIAATTGTARTASVYASTDCLLLCLSAEGLDSLSRYLPPVREMLEAASRARLLPTMMPRGSGFDLLDDTQRDALFECFVPVTVPPRTRILREAQAGAGLCVIVSGEAEVWRQGINGERNLVARLGPGACFGEISLLFDQQVNATVEATTTVTFFAMKPVDFRRFVELFPDIGAHFVRLAEDRMGRPHVQRTAISAEHRVVRSGVQMSHAERATFTTTTGFERHRCPACGYADADIVCVSCGMVQ